MGRNGAKPRLYKAFLLVLMAIRGMLLLCEGFPNGTFASGGATPRERQPSAAPRRPRPFHYDTCVEHSWNIRGTFVGIDSECDTFGGGGRDVRQPYAVQCGIGYDSSAYAVQCGIGCVITRAVQCNGIGCVITAVRPCEARCNGISTANSPSIGTDR